jgi:hypothetical protein
VFSACCPVETLLQQGKILKAVWENTLFEEEMLESVFLEKNVKKGNMRKKTEERER